MSIWFKILSTTCAKLCYYEYRNREARPKWRRTAPNKFPCGILESIDKVISFHFVDHCILWIPFAAKWRTRFGDSSFPQYSGTNVRLWGWHNFKIHKLQIHNWNGCGISLCNWWNSINIMLKWTSSKNFLNSRLILTL